MTDIPDPAVLPESFAISSGASTPRAVSANASSSGSPIVQATAATAGKHGQSGSSSVIADLQSSYIGTQLGLSANFQTTP